MNHNDTGTGNLTGWGAWQSIGAATSHTIRGLSNGKEYRFKLRAVNAHGNSKPAPWYQEVNRHGLSRLPEHHRRRR